jgi:hypothetical protein
MTSHSAEKNAADARPILLSSDAGLSPEPSASSASQASRERRHRMIAETAYFIAEARGFATNQELSDWLAAERGIDQQLSSSDC